MQNRPVPKPRDGLDVGRVLVASHDDLSSRWKHPPQECLDSLAGRIRIRSAESLLEHSAPHPLSGPHRPTPSQLDVVEAVDEERRPDDEVHVHGPVLAVFEGPEPVEDEGLSGRGPGAEAFVEEETVAAEAVGEGADGRVGDPVFAGDLAQGGAGDETMEDELEEPGALQPVGRREGL
ncbi:MAG: hypothetical protein IPK00_20575 [Deltaproteobacteria bacterium]|nr:hypothetical protein [Deltaproteobacteria bacterium]